MMLCMIASYVGVSGVGNAVSKWIQDLISAH